ncbi:hypothetical protein HDU81_008698 [Chytriomyces hyalinus]|nr:hypothetical protein HDU81_008698 [Chytriomyces hyalinus]
MSHAHQVTVKIVKAHNLNKKDLITQNDVYIEIWADRGLFGKQKTTVVGGSDPVFNQSFSFDYDNHELHLDVRDKDLIGSDGIGKATIKLDDNEFPVGKTVLKVVDIYAGMIDFTSNGKVSLEITRHK